MFYAAAHLRDLPSFPTRRSSDLALAPHDESHRSAHFHAERAPPPLSARRTCCDSSNAAIDAATTAASALPLPSRCSRFNSRSEEHTSELQSRRDLVCRLLLEKKK